MTKAQEILTLLPEEQKFSIWSLGKIVNPNDMSQQKPKWFRNKSGLSKSEADELVKQNISSGVKMTIVPDGEDPNKSLGHH